MVRNLGLIFAAALTAECFGVSTDLDGVWRSQGWGLICQVRNSDWQTYAVTRTTCVAASTAKRLTKPDPENEPTLRGRDGSLFSIVRAGDSDQYAFEQFRRLRPNFRGTVHLIRPAAFRLGPSDRRAARKSGGPDYPNRTLRHAVGHDQAACGYPHRYRSIEA